jgi:hypothetical protein
VQLHQFLVVCSSHQSPKFDLRYWSQLHPKTKS